MMKDTIEIRARDLYVIFTLDKVIGGMSGLTALSAINQHGVSRARPTDPEMNVCMARTEPSHPEDHNIHEARFRN